MEKQTESQASKLIIHKYGIWGGYEFKKVEGPRPYFWIGEGDKYLMSLTMSQARKVAEFLSK